MKRLSFLFLALLLFIDCGNDDSDVPSEFEVMFEKFWDDFDRVYPYFEIKGVDWDSVKTASLAEIRAGITEAEFETLLAELSTSLRDIHVSVQSSTTTYKFFKRDQFPANLPDNAINYLTDIKMDDEVLQFGTIENSSIGYLRIKTFTGDHEAFDVTFRELLENEVVPSKSALIIDVRENGGGNEAIGGVLAIKLLQEDQVYKLVRTRNGPGRNDFSAWESGVLPSTDPVTWNNPIIVLTNRGCYSSTESFVLMMKTVPATTIVGDTTGGATGGPEEFVLSNNWTYQISTVQTASPDMQLIEDQGVAPDIVVFNTEESFQQGIDLMLERAIELLN